MTNTLAYNNRVLSAMTKGFRSLDLKVVSEIEMFSGQDQQFLSFQSRNLTYMEQARNKLL